MKPIKLTIPVVLTDEDVIDSLVSCDYDQILDFVCRLDLTMADVGFTEDLIIRLIKSLRGEYKNNPEEFEASLKEMVERSKC